MPEIWKPVLGGRYEISSLGRARSVDHTSNDGRRWKGRILKLAPAGNTRLMFCASIEGKRSSPHVHKLVAEKFIGPCPSGKEVNHVDGNYKNNRLDNLEYVTRPFNSEHAVRHGLMPTKKNGRWHRKWRP